MYKGLWHVLKLPKRQLRIELNFAVYNDHDDMNPSSQQEAMAEASVNLSSKGRAEFG